MTSKKIKDVYYGILHKLFNFRPTYDVFVVDTEFDLGLPNVEQIQKLRAEIRRERNYVISLTIAISIVSALFVTSAYVDDINKLNQDTGFLTSVITEESWECLEKKNISIVAGEEFCSYDTTTSMKFCYVFDQDATLEICDLQMLTRKPHNVVIDTVHYK